MTGGNYEYIFYKGDYIERGDISLKSLKLKPHQFKINVIIKYKYHNGYAIIVRYQLVK